MKNNLSFLVKTGVVALLSVLLISACGTNKEESVGSLEEKITDMQKELPIVIQENEFELVDIKLDDENIIYKCTVKEEVADVYPLPYNDKTKKDAIDFLIVDRDENLAKLILSSEIGIRIVYDYGNTGSDSDGITISPKEIIKFIK